MKQWTALAGLTAILATPVAFAQTRDAEISELKQMLELAIDRIDELEEQQQAEAAAQTEYDVADTAVDATLAEQVSANSAKLANMDWAERIKFQGDFRYRYQSGEVDSFTLFGNEEGGDSRNRNRIRARLGMTADLGDGWEVGIGMATGGDDPVSTNQTLGGGGSTKDINLDMAYFDYTGFEDTSIRGGKFKRTLKTAGKSQLQWDGDWRPEGFDVAWDNGTFFAQGMGTWLESDSREGNSDFSYLLQAGTNVELGPVKLMAGAGYSRIDAEGQDCYFDVDDGGCFGNETDFSSGDPGADPDGPTYLYGFEVYNVFAEAGFEVASMPVKVFGDYIKNDAADDFDTGYLVGAQLGKVKKAGSWQVKAYYEDLESNATLALLSNSDFGGGGTNGKGSVFSAGYGITDSVSLGLTYYMIEKNSDNRAEINDGQDFDVDSLQADIKLKFK